MVLDEMLDALMPLAADVPADPGNPWGVVTVASPLEVRLAGDTAAVRVTQKLASYTPAVNDVVGFLRFGSRWVCVGKIGSA